MRRCGFLLQRADPSKVPDGVTYAGVLLTPDGEALGIHARVVELDGHKVFRGGLFPIDASELPADAFEDWVDPSEEG